jgi:hypothetical protein
MVTRIVIFGERISGIKEMAAD